MRRLFYGCDFDPNPDIDGLRKKLAGFLLRQQQSGEPFHSSPYGLFTTYAPTDKEIMMLNARFAPEYHSPNWVSSSPTFEQEIFPEMFRDYINAGECRRIADDCAQRLTEELQEDEVPVVIGVDHCLTGGLYRALAEKCPNLMLVVFDMHLDAIRPTTRNKLVSYQLEHMSEMDSSFEHYRGDFTGAYDTGSFLHYLLLEGVLKPENLIVLGVQDTPEAWMEDIQDERVSSYLQEHRQLLESGVRIFDLRQLYESEHELEALKGVLRGRNVYLSIDVDVFEGPEGLETRYCEENGISLQKYVQVLNHLDFFNAHLSALDIMEIDINTLGMDKIDVYEFIKKLMLRTLSTQHLP